MPQPSAGSSDSWRISPTLGAERPRRPPAGCPGEGAGLRHAVRVPLNRASDLARIFRERERLKQALRREPTAEELAAAAKLTPETVESLQTLNAAEIRLDAPIGDSDDSQLVERFILEEAAEPELAVEERLLAEHIERAL